MASKAGSLQSVTNRSDPELCTWPAVDVAGWPEPRVPFPVSVPYRPRPDLARLGTTVDGAIEARVLDVDATLPQCLAAKWRRLQQLPGRCVAIAPGLADDPQAVWRRVCAAALAIVAREAAAASGGLGRDGAGHDGAGRDGADGDRPRRLDATDAAGVPGVPGVPSAARAIDTPTAPSATTAASAANAASRAPPPLLRRSGDAIEALAAGWSMPADPGAPFALRALRADAQPVLDWIAGRPAAERPLHALALAIQEDLAWIESPSPGEPVQAAMLHVCWPSGWSPADKVGLDFGAIHAPVGDGGPLRAAAAPLSRVLVSQGPFVRFVWTIAPDDARSRHPGDPPGPAAGLDARADALWFRAERQVTLPMGQAGQAGAAAGGAALFLIRLHLAPLAQIVADPARRARLLASLASMSDATLDYKRLAAIRAIVEREWRAR
jgi:hypothetical protein